MTSITAVGVVTGALVAATLLTLLDPDRRARFRAPLALPFLAFALLTLLSAAVAANRATAFYESKHLAGIALFFVAVNGFDGAAGIRRALGWLFAAVAVVSTYALLQTLACGSSVELPAWAGWLLRVRLEACRAAHPFRAKGFFSIYMTLGGSLLVGLSLLLAPLLVRGTATIRLAAPAVLGLGALGLTYVRNAWLGFGAAVVLLSLLARRFWLLGLLVVGLGIVLAVPSALQTRLRSMLDPADQTALDRLHFWDAGRRMIADAPLLGHGPGGVRLYYPLYKHPEARKARTGHLHNNLVQVAAERGLLGLAAWLGIWATFFVRAGRILRAIPRARADERALVAGSLAAAAGFLVAGCFEYNFGDTEVIDLVWVAMAVPFACAGAAAASARPPAGGSVSP
jgi:O-antigen ligase